MTAVTEEMLEAGARAEQATALVNELIYASKRLGVEEHHCDEELFDIQRVDKAKTAILEYIAALTEEIDELGDVAKGCAKREREAQAAYTAMRPLDPEWIAIREALEKASDWREKLDELYRWTGSAFLAGETHSSDGDIKGELYSWLCGLAGYLGTVADALQPRQSK